MMKIKSNHKEKFILKHATLYLPKVYEKFGLSISTSMAVKEATKYANELYDFIYPKKEK